MPARATMGPLSVERRRSGGQRRPVGPGSTGRGRLYVAVVPASGWAVLRLCLLCSGSAMRLTEGLENGRSQQRFPAQRLAKNQGYHRPETGESGVELREGLWSELHMLIDTALQDTQRLCH